MTPAEFQSSLSSSSPPANHSAPLQALWYDAKGDWKRAHDLVDELETRDGMAVHAYLHRKSGETSNADYWYERSGRQFHRENFTDEWQALVESLLSSPRS